jgi:hypothetical protein
MPDLRERPLRLDFRVNGELVSCLSIFRQGWQHVRLFPTGFSNASTTDLQLEIAADRTWQPRPGRDETRDDRELSIAVCNIEIQP